MRRRIDAFARNLPPLGFLYDLRTYGGLAHAPNKGRAADAAEELGLPRKDWHRNDFLRLLNLVTDSVSQIRNHLNIAAQVITDRGMSCAECCSGGRLTLLPER